MNTIFTVHRDATTDYNGAQIEEFNDKFDSPLRPSGLSPSLSSYCWVLYQNWFGRWQIKEQVVDGIWYTNIWGYKLRNGWYICADDLGKTIFTRDQFKEAREECLRLNKMRKVKVKYYHG